MVEGLYLPDLTEQINTPQPKMLHLLRNVTTPETHSLEKPHHLGTHLQISLGTTGFLGVPFPHWEGGGKNIQQQRPGEQASGVTFRSRESLSVEDKWGF